MRQYSCPTCRVCMLYLIYTHHMERRFQDVKSMRIDARLHHNIGNSRFGIVNEQSYLIYISQRGRQTLVMRMLFRDCVPTLIGEQIWPTICGSPARSANELYIECATLLMFCYETISLESA